MPFNAVTLAGNLSDEPELRFTSQGKAVCNFSVAVNHRTKDAQTGAWTDLLDGFFRCTVWGEQAENAAESLTKGMRVLVSGRLQQKSYDDSEGNKRQSFEVQVDEVGPSVKFAIAVVTKNEPKKAVA